jgi:tetratricopeptide (TPR) repeat protein
LQRDDAARRLLAIGTFETQSFLTRVLSSNDERAQAACATAIAEGSRADSRWLGPLFALLKRDRIVESAAKALTHYDSPSAYGSLIDLARSRQQAYRTTIIRLLGSVVEKPVAEALVGIVSDPTEDAPARTAAADALQELSGQTANGEDAARWKNWLAAHAARNGAQWRAEVVLEQHPLLESTAARAKDQLKQFKNAVRDLLLNQYTRQPAGDKAKTLLGFLNDPNPDVREIGAAIVPEAVGRGQPITEDIHARLIDLIGDPQPDVRLRTIQALTRLADANAGDALLTQLQVETDDELKIWLLRALAVPGVGSVKAVTVVEQLLADNSMRVANEAANTMAALAPLFKANIGLDRQEFMALLNVLNNRTGPPGNPSNEPGSTELRAALITAMGQTSSGSIQQAVTEFPRFLDQNEPPQVRKAALHALAQLGEGSGAGDLIAHELDPQVEPDRQVRQAAAASLGELGSFNYANRLDTSSQESSEPDASVREAAWQAFAALLSQPSTTTRDLQRWATQFQQRHELDREVLVRKELCKKLEQAHDPRSLAAERQRTGDAYLQLNQPAEAVPYLRQALTYWEANQAGRLTIVSLVHELMLALLNSNQYHDAIQFGEDEIRRDPLNEQEIGPAIRNAVDQLISKGDATSLKSAAGLIQEALAMQPPLDDRYRQPLLKAQRERIPSALANPG